MDNKELLQQALEALTFCGDPEKAFDMEEAAAEALRARLAQPEQEYIRDVIVYGTGVAKDGQRIDPASIYKEPEPEPVAWRTFDGEGGYEYRDYDMNESYAEEWAKQNPNHANWVEPLFLKD